MSIAGAQRRAWGCRCGATGTGGSGSVVDAETDRPGVARAVRAASDPAVAARLADRYGRRAAARPTRWRRALPGAVMLAVTVGIALLAYANLGGPGVTGTVTAFTTADDHVDVTFVVRRDKPDNPAVCLVRARSRQGTEVGSAMVTVPPGRDAVRIDYRLPTSAPAVTGEVTGCRYGAGG